MRTIEVSYQVQRFERSAHHIEWGLSEGSGKSLGDGVEGGVREGVLDERPLAWSLQLEEKWELQNPSDKRDLQEHPPQFPIFR